VREWHGTGQIVVMDNVPSASFGDGISISLKDPTVFASCTHHTNIDTLIVTPKNHTLFCSYGSPTTPTANQYNQATWLCQADTGGATDACQANYTPGGNQPINGQCTNGLSFPNPTTLTSSTPGLCAAGNVTSISGNPTGPWGWSCVGIGGGTTANGCSASVQQQQQPVNGQCAVGLSFPNPTTLTQSTPGLCANGSVANITGNSTGPWGWACDGTNGGSNAYGCSATISRNNNYCINAGQTCGSSNCQTYTSAPTTNLCTGGANPSVVSSIGNEWFWTCSSNGKTDSCGAVNNQVSIQNQTLVSGNMITTASQQDQTGLCVGNPPTFPPQWTWDPAQTISQPRGATRADGLTRKVEQYRPDQNGVLQLVATYPTLGGSGCYYENMNVPAQQGNPHYTGFHPECGPFGRTPFRTWLPGDQFWVYAAVYAGDTNNTDDDQPWIGPAVDSNDEYNALKGNVNGLAGMINYNGITIPFNPTNIIIKGITATVNGQQVRPVITLNQPCLGSSSNTENGMLYVADSLNLTIQNIDVDYGPACPQGQQNNYSAKAGVYLAGTHNITLSQMRVENFINANGANGVFAADGTAYTGSTNDALQGTLTLNQVELFYNGGANGPTHNIYVNGSWADPNFNVIATNSWFHDVYYGHEFKSRAQNTTLIGNYFQSATLINGPNGAVASSYDVDTPDGGNVVLKDNVFVKNISGFGSNGNGVLVYYEAEDGADSGQAPYTNSFDAENNTFVAFAHFWNQEQTSPIQPLAFFGPSIMPNTQGFGVPANAFTVQKNVFIGFCNTGDPRANYRGDLSLSGGFGTNPQTPSGSADINLDFSLINKLYSTDTNIVGQSVYGHVTQSGIVRQDNSLGARD
jgi:hypothetical protein